ncbi:MAG: hypothetical protein HN380_26255 [Victivallales bacterium]|jgi:hypothetical protein|nr:hypothetical protein [Victivallales bacterium]
MAHVSVRDAITEKTFGDICHKYGFTNPNRKGLTAQDLSGDRKPASKYSTTFTKGGTTLTVLEKFDKEGRLFDKFSSFVHTARKVVPQFAKDFPESERNDPLPRRTAGKPKLGKRLFAKYSVKELRAAADVLAEVLRQKKRQEANAKEIAKLKSMIADLERLEKGLAEVDLEIPEDLKAKLIESRAKLAELEA